MKPHKANNNLKKRGWIITQIRAYIIDLKIKYAREKMNSTKGITPKGEVVFNIKVKE